MLAQNFKTAEELEITEAQKDALVKTLVLLETGKLTHVRRPRVNENRVATIFTGHFNMDKWGWEASCGSVCCIGGTAELVGGLQPRSLQESCVDNPALDCLFYPYNSPISWVNITPSQAATALRSYLTTGDARWDLAVQP